ncbi:MAG: hypothetical protein ACMUIP_03825 [bacterium]
MKRLFNLSMIKNLKCMCMTLVLILIAVFICYSPNPLGPSLSMPKTTYDVNETIVVNYANLPSSSTNWIGIYVEGASNQTYLQGIYSNGGSQGTMRFGGVRTPGKYDARLFFNDSYILEHTISFTVGSDNQSQTISCTQPGAGNASANREYTFIYP